MAVAWIREEVPIQKNTDGVYLVGGTRVPLDTIIRAYKREVTPERIAQQYPAVKLADIYSVIGYYLHNQVEVEGYLREREEFAKRTGKLNETRFPQKHIKSKLVARTQKKS